MKTAQHYRDEYASLQEKMEALTDLAKEEKREFSEKEKENLEQWEERMSALEEDIKFHEKLEARVAKSHDKGKGEVRHKKGKETEEKKIMKRYSFLKVINRRSKGLPLDGIEAEMHQEAVREAEDNKFDLSGIGVPSMFFQKRDLTAGTSTAYGNTVQTDVGELIEYLWPRMATERLGADVMSGLTSNISFPRQNTIPSATWEGENDDNAESSPTTNTVSLNPNRVGTYVDVSKQLLLQSKVPALENRVRRDIEMAIGNAVDIAAINGSGASNQPTGILNTTGIGDIAGGTNGAAPTWANIVGLETEVATANADLGNLAYLTTPGIRGKLKTTEKATNTGQFVWDNMVFGGVGGNRRMPGEGQLNGYRAAVSTLVPSDLSKGTGTNLHAVIFGNWQELMIGQFGGLDIVIDPYTQAGKSLLRIVINSWWDIAIAHAASFAAMKDADAS